MNRRGFMEAILAASVAPAVICAANLMPVRRLASGVALLQDGLEYAPSWVDDGGLYLVTAVVQGASGDASAIGILKNGVTMLRSVGNHAAAVLHIYPGDIVSFSASGPVLADRVRVA